MWFLAIQKHPQLCFAHSRPHCDVLVVLDRRQWSHQNIMIDQLTTKHKHYTDQIFRSLVAIFNLKLAAR